MAGFIQNILWNSVEGFVEAGKRTAGGYAGDALIKAGDMVENSGRSVGNGIENKFGGYGSAIAGQTYAGPSAKALPSTARKPAIKRSNSSPAAPKSTKSTGPSSYTPLGANKYPGGKQVGAATKQISSGVTGAKSTVGGMGKGVGGVVGGAQKGVTGVTGGAQKAIGGAAKSLPKPFPNNVPYGTSTTPQSANKSKPSSGLNSAKGVAENKANNLPKPYGGNAFPSSDKKTAVKPGQSKPFKVEEKDDKKVAPYPGTNTLPGQGSKTPVKKYKPMERLGPQVEQGKKMQHFTV